MVTTESNCMLDVSKTPEVSGCELSRVSVESFGSFGSTILNLKNELQMFQHIPVGGRLKHFWREWQTLRASKEVLRWLRRGYPLPFLKNRDHLPPLKLVKSCPPHLITRYDSQPQKQAALDNIISELLAKKAIALLPKGQSGFFSRVFLRAKKSGGWRLILDVSELNVHLKHQTFAMDTSDVIKQAVSPGQWACSVDFSDAYHHIPMAPKHRRFLCFQVGFLIYYYWALPFGLSTAPRVFTKVMAPVKNWARQRLFLLFQYLDDWMNSCPTQNLAFEQTVLFVRKCIQLGLIVNFDKSELIPAQVITFLGIVFDFVQGRVFPTGQMLEDIATRIRYLKTTPLMRVQQAESLNGLLAFAAKVVPWGRIHSRHCQKQVSQAVKAQGRGHLALMPLTPEIEAEFLWWTTSPCLKQGIAFQPPPPSLHLQTDASTSGWGIHFQNKLYNGLWTVKEKSMHINVLELRAVLLACQKFSTLFKHQTVQVMLDNSTAVSYINKQGGTHSRCMMTETRRLFTLLLELECNMQAVHLAGHLNVLADLASREGQVIRTEWQLHQSTFKWLCQNSIWGHPKLDMFANSRNKQLPMYMSPCPDPRAFAIDALVAQWPKLTLYAFPPTVTLQKLVTRLKQETSFRILLIAPWDVNATWFHSLREFASLAPLPLPVHPQMLQQPHWKCAHSNPSLLNLHLWHLEMSA